MAAARWPGAITLGGSILALLALAAWQSQEYGRERELARESVSAAGDAVMNALVGGVRSHRRLGQHFSANIQGVLDGLAQARDVRAVALVSPSGDAVLAAGDRQLLELNPPFPPGGRWVASGFLLVSHFTLPPESGGPGVGFGGGRGWGRRAAMDSDESAGAFAPGETAAAILLLDRSRADQAARRAAWLRGSIVVAGSLVVLSLVWAWRTSVRLTEAHGRARALEIEARHFRDLSQAAAGLAHETRNPLGLIRGWAQRWTQADADPRERRQQARAVVEECDRVTARINQFLAFVRPSEPKPECFDAAQLVDELAVLLEPDLDARQVSLSRPQSPQPVSADREMLRQAVFNLLQNAVQASPAGASVAAEVLRGRNGYVRIEVADRGRGVPAEAADRLFTPYFTTRADGTGLGLAIVRRIAAAHGWTAGYAPRPGGGAIFWLDGIHA